MGTLYGSDYSHQIDVIADLVKEHLQEFGEKDLYGALDRIHGAVANGTAEYIKQKDKTQAHSSL